MSTKGLSLIEVIVAMAILSVGVLAAAAMQAGGLSSSRQAVIYQQVTDFARAEVEMQRQLRYMTPAPSTPSCLTTLPAGYTCTVSIYPCRLDSATLSCHDTSFAASELVAFHIVVGVAQGDKALTLTTVAKVKE